MIFSLIEKDYNPKDLTKTNKKKYRREASGFTKKKKKNRKKAKSYSAGFCVLKAVDDNNQIILFSRSSNGVVSVLGLFFLKLEPGIGTGYIGFSNPIVQNLTLDWEFKIPTAMSFLHLGPIQVRNGVLGTPRSRRLTVVVTVGQTRNEVHGLPMLGQRVDIFFMSKQLFGYLLE